MNRTEVWTFCQAVMGSLGPHYQREMNKVIRERVGFQAYILTYYAKGLAGEPFTVSRRHDMTPYSHPRVFEAQFEAATAEGYFERVSEGAYRLTAKGDAGIHTVFTEAQNHIRKLGPALQVDAALMRLGATLEKIVKATLAAPEPSFKPYITYTRWTDKGLEDSPIAKVDQYVTDLTVYRDDAHIGAWRHLGVSGHAWEALTFVWREAANTPEALVEQLPNRGHSAEDYRVAFGELVTKSWVMEAEGAYRLTEAGRQVREKAETETDRLFFIGWQGLTEAELKAMAEDLQTLQTRAQRLTAQKTWTTLDDCGYQFYLLINDERRAAIDATGFTGNSWYALYNALGRDRVTPADLQARNPYEAIGYYHDMFVPAIEGKGLQPNEDGTFSLTGTGQAAIENILRATADIFMKADLMPADQLAPLAESLYNLTTAILADDSLPNRFMRYVHAADPGPSAHPLVRIDQYNDELNAFRDGCHVASWAHTGLSGIEWETLTLIWHEEANTPEALRERLAYRQHSLEDYQAAVATLVERGLIQQDGDGYVVSEAGRELREAAEADTDAAFYAQWSMFDADALNQLFQQIHALYDATLAKLHDRTAARCEGLYAKLNDSLRYLPPLYQPKLGTLFQDVGVNAPGAFFSLLLGLGSPVQPFNVQVLYERFPYVCDGHWEGGVAHLVSKGYAKAEGAGYVITPEGKAAEDAINSAFYGALNEISPQVSMNLERLLELLRKVAVSCQESPFAKSIHYVYHADRSQQGTALAQLDYVYDCLNAFRDDSHVAAWREARVDGPAREAYTLIWRGNAKTAAEVGEQLAFRRISAEAYADYLQQVVNRGWLAVTGDGVYTVTQAGKEERELVEKLTNRNFYAPWDVLSQAEVEELRGLLQEFDAALVALQPQTQEASS